MKHLHWLMSVVLAFLMGADSPGTIEFLVNDVATKETVPCRIHLLDLAGKPVKPEGITLPYWRDHFVCDGAAKVQVPVGEYRYEIERGPEYAVARQQIVVKAGETAKVVESLKRITDLKQEGWWSGETHVHRPLSEVELLMRAEDLHVAVVETWWNDRNQWTDRALPERLVTVFDKTRMYDLMGGEDERGGGALLFSGLKAPLPIAGSKRESPPSSKWLAEGKKLGAWVDCEKPFWWDFPLWLSTGQLDSVGIANNHMHRTGVYPNGEAWGRPRDREKFPEPYGNALWTQTIYYHALNAGFRLPPSAGSASGVLPNPVGYNRMYAHVEGALTWDGWWSAVRAGRVMITNGPLLRLKANGQLSGHVFKFDGAKEFIIDGQLDSRDPIAAIELVQNGNVQRIEKLPARITLKESGWFLVRAIADVPHTFRFASTAPWYVEIDGQKQKPNRESCEFFQQWTEERIDFLRTKLTTDEERREVLPVHEAARRFWDDRASP
jgi:hypothetical protein